MFVQARRFGINWRLDLNEGIDLAIYLGHYQNYSKRTMEHWLRPGSLVLDLGANVGSHSLRMARQIGPNGLVVAIEPTNYAFDKLKINVGLNPELKDRLVLVQAALTDGSECGEESKFYSRWPLRRMEIIDILSTWAGLSPQPRRATSLSTSFLANCARQGTSGVRLALLNSTSTAMNLTSYVELTKPSRRTSP